jgi:glycosyltransferase involved in cell wall biosynthesis
MRSVDVSVLTTGHDVADARLHRLVATLVRRGLSVEVHGLGNAADGPFDATVHTTRRGSLLRRFLRALVLPCRARGHVVVVIDPELALPALLRRVIGRRSSAGRRLVVDIHEDYLKLLMDRDWATGLRLTAARTVVATAVWASRHADLTVVADQQLPPALAQHRIVVPNLPILDMLPATTDPEPRARAVYIGDVRRSRGLHIMLAALEDSLDWTLDVVGPVAVTDRLWLERWRRSSPARDRVTFHGRRPPKDAWKIAAGAWVGLCLLEPTPAFVTAMPAKIYEYFACGLAVMTTPLPRAATLVSEAGAGVVVRDLDAASTTLEAWGRDPEVVLKLRSAAMSWTQEHLARQEPYRDFGQAVAQLAGNRHCQRTSGSVTGAIDKWKNRF